MIWVRWRIIESYQFTICVAVVYNIWWTYDDNMIKIWWIYAYIHMHTFRWRLLFLHMLSSYIMVSSYYFMLYIQIHNDMISCIYIYTVYVWKCECWIRQSYVCGPAVVEWWPGAWTSWLLGTAAGWNPMKIRSFRDKWRSINLQSWK